MEKLMCKHRNYSGSQSLFKGAEVQNSPRSASLRPSQVSGSGPLLSPFAKTLCCVWDFLHGVGEVLGL